MSEEKLQRQCGEWRLEREIGQGAYGVVYLAAGAGGERVAVKVCRREDVGDERFTRELRGAKLYRAIPPQEGLVRMRDLVETEWGFFTVMDLADDEFASDSVASSGRAASPFAAASGVCRPKTLARVIEGEKALPLKECVQLALSLAKGLATLQRHHLLHRDIKPGNVLYVKGQPVLSDPGLIVEESEAASLVGTPGYIPPEKFTDAASDIYSLGLTLKAASFGRKLEDLDKGPSLEADTGAPLFPTWWRILNKATDPTPSRRYQSAKALLKDMILLRIKTALPSIRVVLTIAVAIGLTFALYHAVSAKNKVERKEKEERDYIDREKQETMRSIETIKQDLVKDITPLKRVATIVQTLNDVSTSDDATWSSFCGSYFCHVDESHRQRLKRVEEKDPVSAAKMRDILDKMLEIDKKGEKNNRQIKVLRDENVDKGASGASERYNQAEMLSMENEKLVKAWLSHLERFTLIEDEVKIKE